MVAYSFQKRFAPLIREGLKTQTIRSERKRHARPGELLQLFTGMRTASCERIVPDVVCTAVLPLTIGWASGRIARIETGMVPVRNLDHFAVLDGFLDIDDMTGFWLERHGARPFEGVVIEWSRPSHDMGGCAMHVIATIPVDIHIAKPGPGDTRLGEAAALISDQRATVVLTERGLYLQIDRSDFSWGIDLNGLARAMADAVARPKPAPGREEWLIARFSG